MAGQELPQLVAEGGLVPQLPAPLGLGLGLAQLCRETERDEARELSPFVRAGQTGSRPHSRPGDSRRSSRSMFMLQQLRPGIRTSRAPAAASPQAPPLPGAEHLGKCSSAARSILGAVVRVRSSWEGRRESGGRFRTFPDSRGRMGAEPQPTLLPGPAAALGVGSSGLVPSCCR